jgi:hypothetical protein
MSARSAGNRRRLSLAGSEYVVGCTLSLPKIMANLRREGARA